MFVAKNGRTAADFAIGEARPGVAMGIDTLTLWLSACKPIGAVAIGQLIERGKVGVDDPVADFIPEFATHEKDRVTLRHILTHTAGLRYVDTGWPLTTWSEIVELAFADVRLEPNWTPGQHRDTTPRNRWFILGEVVRRVDGRPYESYVRDEIFEPLTMKDSWVGMPVERFQCLWRSYGDVVHDRQAPTAPAAAV